MSGSIVDRLARVSSVAEPSALPSLPNGEKMYTVPQVAKLLQISRTKAYGMAASGDLPTVRMGSLVRVPSSALSAWIERRTTAGA